MVMHGAAWVTTHLVGLFRTLGLNRGPLHARAATASTTVAGHSEVCDGRGGSREKGGAYLLQRGWAECGMAEASRSLITSQQERTLSLAPEKRKWPWWSVKRRQVIAWK